MPTPTDNHNLDVGYVEGESWDYNDEFQTIEEKLVVRDTEANRGNYTAHSDAIFIATDTGAVFDGDGTNWNAATRSYESVDADEVLSTYHVSASDDLQARIDSAGANSDIVVHGTHNVTLDASDNGIVIDNSNVTLRGPGTVKLADGEVTTGGTPGNVIRIGNGTSVSNVSITGDLTVDGNQANNVGTTENTPFKAIQVDGGVSHVNLSFERLINSSGMGMYFGEDDPANLAEHITVDGVRVRGGSADQILWQGADYVSVVNCWVGGNDHQDAIEPAGEAQHWVVANNLIDSPAASGVDVFDGASYGVIANNTIVNAVTNSGEAGVNLSASGGAVGSSNAVIGNTIINSNTSGINIGQKRCVVAGNVISGSSVLGINVSGTGSYNTLSHNLIEECGEVGIWLNGCERNRVVGNIVRNNNQGGNSADGGSGINVRASGNVETVVAQNLCYDDQSTGTQVNGIFVNNAVDARLQDNTTFGNTSNGINDSGTRTTIDGWGENAGDPSSTGDWNGNGFEGAGVVDTTNDVKYVYRGGAWV